MAEPPRPASTLHANYTDYFGPSLFTHMELTQQTACNFGQSWPGLVWIPTCYYFDTTVRHALGIDWGDRTHLRPGKLLYHNPRTPVLSPADPLGHATRRHNVRGAGPSPHRTRRSR